MSRETVLQWISNRNMPARKAGSAYMTELPIKASQIMQSKISDRERCIFYGKRIAI